MHRPITLLIWLISFQLFSQIPQTDLYQFNLIQDTEANFQLVQAKYLSGFNPGGYNNQPNFISDSECLISVQMAGSSQTDIYLMNIDSDQLYRITKTDDSEFSPTLTPDKKHISCIKQSNDGSGKQLLWEYPLNRSNMGEALFENLNNVGYHSWISQRKLALFLVDDPVNLSFIELGDQDAKLFTNNIGRGMQKTKSGRLLFLQKKDETRYYIKEYDPISKKARIVAETPGNSQDFAFSSDGSILMANQSKIYKLNIGIDKEWLEIADLSIYGLNNVTRIAINSKNQIIIVNNR